MALISQAATQYSLSSKTRAKQPDMMNMQVQSLRPVFSKNVEIVFDPARFENTVPTLRISLPQDGKECMAGYLKYILKVVRTLGHLISSSN